MSVALYALIVAVLEYRTLFRIYQLEMDRLRGALRAGDVEMVKAFSDPLVFQFPTDVVVTFALLGLAMLALAWSGRGVLAWLIPLLVPLAATEIRGAILGENDWGLWTLSLGPLPTGDGDLPWWPLAVGLAVQTALLVGPLALVPARRAPVSLASAARRVAVPAAAVALVAFAFIPYPSTRDLYTVPIIVVGLCLVAGAVITGSGSIWLRVPAAILTPVFVHRAIYGYGYEYLGDRDGQSLAVLIASTVVVGGTLAAPRLRAALGRAPNLDDTVPTPA